MENSLFYYRRQRHIIPIAKSSHIIKQYRVMGTSYEGSSNAKTMSSLWNNKSQRDDDSREGVFDDLSYLFSSCSY